MNSPECDDLLQQRLDGMDAAIQDALEIHLVLCKPCRELHAVADLFEEGLLALRPPTPPPDLTNRIVARVLAERPGRLSWRRRLATVAAAAACLLAAPLASLVLAPSSAPVPGAVVQARPASPAAAPLHQTAEEAGAAVASLTDRLAGQVRQQALVIWTVATPPELPQMDPLQAAAELPSPLDPAQSLRDASQGVSAGLETVAGSARRAFAYFIRELPSLEPAARTVQ